MLLKILHASLICGSLVFLVIGVTLLITIPLGYMFNKFDNVFIKSCIVMIGIFILIVILSSIGIYFDNRGFL